MISSVVVVTAIILLAVFIKKKPPEPEKPPVIQPNNTYTEKLETEFILNNKLREPYRIYVKQTSIEEALTNGIKTFQFVEGKKIMMFISSMKQIQMKKQKTFIIKHTQLLF